MYGQARKKINRLILLVKIGNILMQDLYSNFIR